MNSLALTSLEAALLIAVLALVVSHYVVWRHGRRWALLGLDNYRVIEQSLSQREREYQALLSALPDLVLTLTEDGIFIGCSAATEITPKLGKVPVTGKTLDEILFGEALSVVKPAFLRVVALKEPVSVTFACSGDLHLEARIAHCNDPFGTVVAIVRDITDQKKLEDELRQSKQNLEDAVLLLAADRRRAAKQRLEAIDEWAQTAMHSGN